MKKADPDNPKLTKNDQEVLKSIIEQAKIPDSEIAKKIGVSPQAVFKIRNKLERVGIIKGYQPVIDFKKIGIRVLSLIVLRITPVVWEKFSDEQMSERIREIPYIINAFRVSDSDATHILIMGFRDHEQKDRVISRIQTKFSKEIELKSVYSFSSDRIITQSQAGLLYEIMDKKEYSIMEFFKT